MARIQEITRCDREPALGAVPDDPPPQWFLRLWPQLLRTFQHVNDLHRCFETNSALLVAAGQANYTYTLIRPRPYTSYFAALVPDWGTTVYLTNVTSTSCKFNFGTVSTGNNVVQVLIVGP